MFLVPSPCFGNSNVCLYDQLGWIGPCINEVVLSLLIPGYG
jgi:hypothetical protein